MKRRDIFSPEKRSLVMSRIRSKDTKLDQAMKQALTDAGLGFRMYPKMFGNPDFLVGEKIMVFCDSSFWHGRNWKRLRKRLEMGSNSSYWVAHIAKNRNRDREVNRQLCKLGYSVLRFWDEEVLKDPKQCVRRIEATVRKLQSGSAGASG